MGEYAKYHGEDIKIGTCEDMYYLRADQADLVTATRGNVDPIKHGTDGSIRFRFPFPEEDGVAPGAFDKYNKSVHVHGVSVPAGVEHYSVQFTASVGYVMSIPCPESTEYETRDGGMRRANLKTGVQVHYNGWRGSVHIEQQKWWDGMLVTVCSCGGCGAKWRLETLADAQPIIDGLIAEADRKEREAVLYNYGHPDIPLDVAYQGKWHRQMAERVREGYTQPGQRYTTIASWEDAIKAEETAI